MYRQSCQKVIMYMVMLYKKVKLAITTSVQQETRNSVFSSIQVHSMENHVLDTDLRDDHITVMIRLMINMHLTTFLHELLMCIQRE